MTNDEHVVRAGVTDSDDALWVRALGGDEVAFARVFDRHVDRVHRHARRFVARESDAEDITAIVFLEAWRLRHRVRVVDGSIIAWLLVTAVNVARNMVRSRIRYESAIRGLRIDTVSDHADEVLKQLVLEGARAPLRAAFETLSRGDQEVLALCVLEELRPREVAVLMRVPAATIRTRLNRAKRRLRVALEKLGPGVAESWLEA